MTAADELEALAAVVVDPGRAKSDRDNALAELRHRGVRFAEHAWRVAVRGPLQQRLVEVGLLAAGDAIDDFDDVAPLLELDLAILVGWAIRTLKLRFVRDPVQLVDCAGASYRDALARVTGAPVTIEVDGRPRSPDAVRVHLDGVETPLRGDLRTATFKLLAAYADRSRIATRLNGRGCYLPTEAQRAAADKHGLVSPPPIGTVLRVELDADEIVPRERSAMFETYEPIVDERDDAYEPDAAHDRRRLVELACGLDARLELVELSGLNATIAVDDDELRVRLPRVTRRDDQAFERGILAALSKVVEPRLAMSFAITTDRRVVLATPDELVRLRTAGLLDHGSGL